MEDISLREALVMALHLMHFLPERVMEMAPKRRRPLMIASDAQASRVIGGVFAAVMIVDCDTNELWGRVWTFSSADLEALGYPDFPMENETRNPIAAAEVAAVTATYEHLLNHRPEVIAYRGVIHWIDNTVALHSVVKGGSKNKAVDRACTAVRTICLVARCRPWFEYIRSEANWSDGASRELVEDVYAKENGLTLDVLIFPRWLWLVSLSDMWKAVIRYRVHK